jgi:hypothetical protein
MEEVCTASRANYSYSFQELSWHSSDHFILLTTSLMQLTTNVNTTDQSMLALGNVPVLHQMTTVEV